MTLVNKIMHVYYDYTFDSSLPDEYVIDIYYLLNHEQRVLLVKSKIKLVKTIKNLCWQFK